MAEKRAFDVLGGLGSAAIERDTKQPRTAEDVRQSIKDSIARIKSSTAQIDASIGDRIKAEAVSWDSTWEDDEGRVGTGSEPGASASQLWGSQFSATTRTPWMCATFPQLWKQADFEGAPALRVTVGGRTFGSAAAAFGYAKASFIDERLGATEDYKNAFADVPAGATPCGDAFPEGLARAVRVDKASVAARVAALGKKFTKAKAGRLYDEIEGDWLNDEADIEAMKAVLASKFSDDNPAFRDLLLATGDKPLYQQLSGTPKGEKIWEVGAVEADVTTSGLGLYGDLLMERRAELRSAAAA